jgi:hypothetical protein
MALDGHLGPPAQGLGDPGEVALDGDALSLGQFGGLSRLVVPGRGNEVAGGQVGLSRLVAPRELHPGAGELDLGLLGAIARPERGDVGARLRTAPAATRSFSRTGTARTVPATSVPTGILSAFTYALSVCATPPACSQA